MWGCLWSGCSVLNDVVAAAPLGLAPGTGTRRRLYPGVILVRCHRAAAVLAEMRVGIVSPLRQWVQVRVVRGAG